MARVEIAPIAHKFRFTPDWLLPCPPPIFPDGDPSATDIALAQALIDALDERSKAWYARFLGPCPGSEREADWSSAMPDWEERLVEGRSIIPAPIFVGQAQQALRIFKRLRVVDLPGRPTFGECSREWVFDFVAAIFGAYDAETGNQLIRECLLLISKKNTKSTIAAGIMLTAVTLGWREEEESLILAPTKEVADNSFKPAASMVRADEDLTALFGVQDHSRAITHRVLGSKLKVVAADTDTVSGKKSGRILVDELWLFGKKAGADSMLLEATGGQISRKEGFIIYLTTQSDDPPAGVFKEKLEYFRNVRDGKIDDRKSLGIMYEFPAAIVQAKEYLDPANFYITNPNLGVSISGEWLKDQLSRAREKNDGTLQKLLAKHLNVEIGLSLRTDRWEGADHWQSCAAERVTFEDLLARSEIIDVGIDGGGLDDLLGFAAVGREESGHYLIWNRAWAYRIALDRRKSEAQRFGDFEKDGDLVIVDQLGDDVAEVADLVRQISDAGLLDKIGVDPIGLGAILDALLEVGIDFELIVGIQQGYKLNGAIKTLARWLAAGQVSHGGRPMMDWCVGNAKIEPKGNAITITKQASGFAKIDPLMATFNAVSLMSLNPEGRGKSFWEVQSSSEGQPV